MMGIPIKDSIFLIRALADNPMNDVFLRGMVFPLGL